VTTPPDTPVQSSEHNFESDVRPGDRRGSPIPTYAMIATRFMELRKRRGLMIALIMVFIGIPTIFLTIRLLAHAFDPHSYGPAGGSSVFGTTVVILFSFGFIVAATLGCTAGAVDLTEGVFRHLVVTGRSRVALYLARIPAGLAIIVPLVAVGFTIVCAVCVFAAPSKLSFDGTNVPIGLSKTGFVSWAESHPDQVVCDFPYNFNGSLNLNVPCGPNGHIIKVTTSRGFTPRPAPSKAQLDAAAGKIAEQNYKEYSQTFLTPSLSLMVEAGLWIELEAALGFVVGLGLASLMGQRTVPVVLMILLEVILTPLLTRVQIPHLIDGQRALVGLAMSHIEPSALPAVSGIHGGQNGVSLLTESTTVAVVVIVGWVVVWTALGVWRMATRDA